MAGHSAFFAATPNTTPPTQGETDFNAGLLQATLAAMKITAMVSPLWNGPQLDVYAVALGLGEDPRRVEAKADALAMAVGADSCRVARCQGRLLVEVPKPSSRRRPLRAARLEQLNPPAPTAVAIGISTGGQVQWLDLADERTCHVVIGGTTGSGKSKALQWLLYRLVRQNAPQALHIIALDPKRTELVPFAHVPHLAHPVVHAPIEMSRLMAWVGSELDRRAQSGRAHPRLLVVIEEVADLLKTTPDVERSLARIAEIGRGLGVHLVATTQQPGAKSLGSALVNFPARLLGRVASATLTYGAAGRKGTAANKLLGRGDFLFITADGISRVQVPLIDGRQLTMLPRTTQINTLDNELPGVAWVADVARDKRGGAGRRLLSPDDYRNLEDELAAGAGPAKLRRFGIGYTRARRIHDYYRSEQE